MSARSVNNQVMIFLRVTCCGVVLHPRLAVRTRRPPNYIARIAKITGMLRWIVLILWMSSKSIVDGLDIPTLLLAFIPCYT